MTSWKIIYDNKFEAKEFAKLSSTTQKRILKAIDMKLTTHPDIYGKPLKHQLSGYWSLRVGDYRIIYKILPDKTIVIITAIDHRRGVYEKS